MARSSTWSGWIGFAGWLLVIIGILDFFEGLIAVIRGQYFVVTASQIIVFDLKTWGWITLVWGIAVAVTGLLLLAGSGFARWLTIIVVSLNLVGQLGFVGSAQYPLWALTVVVLTVIALYALIVHWDERPATA